MDLPSLSNLTAMIAGVGALGTTAFGLVDSLKALPGGGISRSGFKFISQTIDKLIPAPEKNATEPEKAGLSRADLLYTLRSQWINGVDKNNQINIAKSLIKLRLTPDTAPALASATGVDAEILSKVASSIQSGTALTQPQTDVYGRFDVLLTTLLDQAYQRAEQRYRNAAKVTAIPLAIALAVIAVLLLDMTDKIWQAVLVGLIATPIAPIAKDISSAITNAVQAFQPWKK